MVNAKKDPPGAPNVIEVLPTGAWKNEPCFVIGGGPSLKGFDFERLRGKGRVLGVNQAWRIPVVEVVYIKDNRLILANEKEPGWFDAKCVKLTEQNGRHYKRPGFYWVKQRNELDVWGETFEEGILRTDPKKRLKGANSGIDAVNVATCLGCSPVYLLGFDLTCPPAGYENWHDDYKRFTQQKVDRISSWVTKTHGLTFEGWTDLWYAVKDQIRVPVYNLNPNSALDCFEKLDPEEVLS